MRTRLYVIQKHGTDQFWTSSSEHGSGWSPGRPKQSFSPSELTHQIRLLIDHDWFCDCDIVELVMPATASTADASTVADEAARLRLTDAECEDLRTWQLECKRQGETATEGGNEELAQRWTDRRKRAFAMLKRHVQGGET